MALLSDRGDRGRGSRAWTAGVSAASTIVKSFDRGDFVGSVKFVDSLVGPAEEMNHHPDIAISWSQVEVALSTHAEGGVTENDFKLAEKVEELA